MENAIHVGFIDSLNLFHDYGQSPPLQPSKKQFEKYHKNFEIVKKKIKEVEQKDKIRKFQPPVSGEEIMEYFGLSPCKEIGAIKEAIKEAILEGIIANEHKPAFDFIVKKGKEMGLGN